MSKDASAVRQALFVLLAVALAHGAEAGRRNGGRDFPNFSWCPYYYDRVAGQPVQSTPNGAVVFVAGSSAQRVTLLACDRDPDSNVDIAITDFVVVKRTVWASAFDAIYPGYIDDPITNPAGGCYVSAGRTITGRFDREASAFTAAELPFRDVFRPTPRSDWLLDGVTAASGVGCTSNLPADRGCLILARSARAENSDGRCSTATLTVRGLTAGQEYVVDFDWFMGGLNSNATPALDVFVTDAPPGISVADVSVPTGTGVSAVFPVTLAPPSSTSTTVTYATSNGTAVAGVDYVTSSSQVTIPAGETSASVSVPVIPHAGAVGSRTFRLNIATPTAGVAVLDSQGLGTITDAATPSLSVADKAVVEGNAGTVNAQFTVSLTGNPAGTVTVDYATEEVTATEGSDYVAKHGTLTFGLGTTSQSFTVLVKGDTAYESDETFHVVLSAPSGAVLGRAQATGTIGNDDPAVNNLSSLARNLVLGSVYSDAVGPAPSDVNWFRYSVGAGRSYCVEVDNGKADVSVRDPVLTVYRSNATTVVGSNDDLAEEPAATLLSRVCYISGVAEDNYAKVVPFPGTNAGGVRIRVVETTLYSPWFFSGGGYEAFILMRGTTSSAHSAVVTVVAPGGATLGSQSGLVPGNGSYNLLVSAGSPVGFGLATASGGVVIAHDGPPGGVIANVTSMSFSSGVSFDTPASPRQGFR